MKDRWKVDALRGAHRQSNKKSKGPEIAYCDDALFLSLRLSCAHGVVALPLKDDGKESLLAALPFLIASFLFISR